MINQLIREIRNELPVTAKEIEQHTKQDRIFQEVGRYVSVGWPEKCPKQEIQPYFQKRWELQVVYGCLLWGTRIVIPEALRRRTLTRLHETHPGRDRMVSAARQYCWWPGMDKEISDWVASCSQCAGALNSPARAPLHPWNVTGGPWKRVHADFAGPVNGLMFLILVDSLSKWPEVVIMRDTTASRTDYPASQYRSDPVRNSHEETNPNHIGFNVPDGYGRAGTNASEDDVFQQQGTPCLCSW
ncbi:hypothetical protein D918_10029 [Trichuris suis]|nr:hypothetical protein D918_10029 [Trichuris suis]